MLVYRRSILTALALAGAALILGAVGVLATQYESEPNNDLNTADSIVPDDPVAGNLHVNPLNDIVDGFKFPVKRGQGIEVSYTETSGSRVIIHLVDKSTMTDRWSDVLTTTTQTHTFWTSDETPSGEWGIVMELDTARPSPSYYTFTVSLDDPSDGGSIKDAPSSTGAMPVPLNVTYLEPFTAVGHLGNLDRQDCYSVHFGRGEYLEIGFRSLTTAERNLTFRDSTKAELRYITSKSDELANMLFYTANETPPLSTFYIWVNGTPEVGSYVILLNVYRQWDLMLEKDAGGTDAGSDVVSPDYPHTNLGHGMVGDLDKADGYLIRLGRDENVTITLEGSCQGTPLTVTLKDPEQVVVWNGELTGGPAWERIRFATGPAPTEQWYSLRITRDAGHGDYGYYGVIVETHPLDDWWLGEDAGETTGTASEIVPGAKGALKSGYGSVGTKDTADVYTFMAGEGDVIVFGLDWVNPATPATRATLIGSLGPMCTVEGVFQIRDFYTAAETPLQPMYVEITTQSDELVDYWLVVCVYKQEEGPYDPEWMHDMGDAPSTKDLSEPKEPGSTLRGIVADLDVIDGYKFEAGAGKTIEISFMSWVFGGSALDLALRNGEDVTLGALRASYQTGPVSMQYYTDLDTPVQWWYVYINTSDISPMTDDPAYELRVTLSDQNDGYSSQDAGGSLGSAMDAMTLFGGTYLESFGQMGDSDQRDIYKLQAGNGDVLYAYLTYLPSMDCELKLYDAHGDVAALPNIAREDGRYCWQWISHFVTANETPVQWFYLEVTNKPADALTEYILVARLDYQDDGPVGPAGDAPMGIATSFPISPAQVRFDGLLGDLDRADCFSLPFGQGQVITIGFEVTEAQDEATEHVLTLRDPDNITVLELHGVLGEEVWGTFVSSAETPIEDWFVRVESASSASMTDDTRYYFEVFVNDQAESDASPGGDAPADAESAASRTQGRGVLEDLDTKDAYRFQAGGGDVIRIYYDYHAQGANWTIHPAEAWRYLAGTEVDWGLLDPQMMFAYNYSESDVHSIEYYTAHETPRDWWYLVFTGEGGYSFSVSTSPQSDAMSGRDAPASKDGAVDLLMRVPNEGVVRDLDTEDVFCFVALPGYDLTLEIGLSAADVQAGLTLTAKVIDQRSIVVGTLIAMPSSGRASAEYSVLQNISTDLFWYIEVTASGPLQGPYTLNLSYKATANPLAPEIVPQPPPTSYNESSDLVITVTVTDPDGVASVTLYYRLEGELTWRSLAMTADGDTWSATIPSEHLQRGKRLLYYFVAADTAGNEQQYGSVSKPLNLALETLPPAEPAKTYDLWLGLVLGAVIGFVTALLVVWSRKTKPQAGPPAA